MDEKALEAAVRVWIDAEPGPDTQSERNAMRAAIAAYLQALSPGSTGEREDLDAMPFGEDFLAESRFGDWLTVRRFDPKKPGDFSGNAVINGRAGRWWYPLRWRPLPAPPSAMLSAAGERG